MAHPLLLLSRVEGKRESRDEGRQRERERARESLDLVCLPQTSKASPLMTQLVFLQRNGKLQGTSNRDCESMFQEVQMKLLDSTLVD